MSRTAMLLVVALCVVAVLATPATLPRTITQWYTRTTNPNKNGLSRFSETFTLPNGHSLIIAMDNVGYVQTFNASTGETNWSYPLNTSYQGELRALYVKGNTVFIASAYNLATVNAVTGAKIAEFSSSVSLTFYNLPLDVDNVYANSDYHVFKFPLATLLPTEIFTASQTVTTMLLLSSNPWKLIVFSSYNRNISVIDATYTVVSSTTSVTWSAAPLLVGTTLLLANTKSSAVEVTAFPDANMTTPMKFIDSKGHGYTIYNFYSLTNSSGVTIVAVQYTSYYSGSKAWFSAWKLDGNLTVDDELIATIDDPITTVVFKEAIFVISGSSKVFTRYNLTSKNATKISYPLNADSTSSYMIGDESLFFVGSATIYMLCPYMLEWRTQYRSANSIYMLAWSNAKGRGKNARNGGLVFGDSNAGVGFLLDSERVNSTLSAAMGCSPTTELHIAEGVVYVGACSKVLAYGVTNNTKLWESATLESSLYNPFYNSGRLFISNNNGKAYILNVFSNGAMTSVSSPSCNYQMSFFAFGTDVFALCSSYNKKVVRITPDNKMVETADTTNYIRGVANDDKAVYIIDDSGTLYTAKLTSFDKPWTGANTKVESATSTSPIGLSMIKENLYAGSYYSRLSGITPSSGKKMFELVTEGTTTPPFLFNGKLYFTTGSGYLYQMPTGTISAVGEPLQKMAKSVRVDTSSTNPGSPAISADGMFFFADSYGVFGVNAVTMATIWNKTEVTSCVSAYSYMGVAYAKCGDAFYSWDLYTGVRYMQSGTLSSGKIAYTQNIIVVADNTELISGTAMPMLYAPNELPKPLDGNGDGGAGEESGSKLWILGVVAAIVIIAVLAFVAKGSASKGSGRKDTDYVQQMSAPVNSV